MPEKRLSIILISSFLTLFLGAWVLISALDRTIGEPQLAKDLLHKSGIYTAIIPSQLAETQKANTSLAGIPLDNPEIQKLLGSSLDAAKIEAEGDKAVDGIYAWLQGTSDKPQIKISATPDQQSLATSLGELAAKHARALPTCSPQGSMASEIATDPFSATCLPIGLTPETVKGLVTGEISTNPALAAETTVTEDDLTLSNGKTITNTFSAAPIWYQRAQMLPLYLVIAASVCAVLLLLILGVKRGVRSVGKHLFVVGVTLAICAVLVAWATNWLFEALTPKGISPDLASAIAKLSALFHDGFRNNIVVLSLFLIGAGAVILVASFVLGRMRRAPAPESLATIEAKTPGSQLKKRHRKAVTRENSISHYKSRK